MILEQLFIITAFVGGIMAILNMVGANLYDTKEIKRQRQLSRHPHARQYRQRPLISVIIPVHNDERAIERCLSGLWRGSYRKFEIIVVDGASQDSTKRIVKKLMAEQPKRSVRLIARRSPGTGVEAIAASYKKYASGELVLLLNVGDILDKRALHNAVQHFNAEPDICILRLNHRVISAFSTVGLFQQYQELVRQRSKKFTSVSNSDYEGTGAASAATIYRRNVFLDNMSQPVRQFGNRAVRSYYASDVIANTEPLQSFYGLLRQTYRWQLGRLQALRHQRRLFFSRDGGYSNFLTWFGLPLALCAGITSLFVPLLLSYFIYLAVKLHEPTFFILSWVILSLFLLLSVWGDEHLKFRQKAVYSAFIPMTYAWFYALSFVQIFVVLRAATSRD